MAKKRLYGVDLLKSIAIFGVIFIHSINNNNNNIILEYISSLFRFCVPIFIIYFAYFFNNSLNKCSNKYEYFNFIKNRFLLLLIPYSFFTILYFILLTDFSTFQFKSLITGYWSGYGWPGQYFFIILFQLILIFPILKKIFDFFKEKVIYFTIIFAMFYLATTYYLWENKIISLIDDRFFIYWVPYVLIGMSLSNLKIDLKYKYIILPLSLAVVIFEKNYLLMSTINHSPYIILSVFIISIVLSIYFFDLNIKSKNIHMIVELISNKSLGLFVLNPLIIYFTKPLFLDIIVNLDNYKLIFFTFLYSFLIFIICLLLVNIIEKTSFKRLVSN